MRIVVTGTRGVPNILGGVETHCQELYPRIVAQGHEVILIRRKPYVDEKNILKEYQGVKLVDIWTPRQKSIEAILHTFFSIIYARFVNADILHVHSIGPAIMIPFAKLLGQKVVMTHHGPDYDRQKWNRTAKRVLKFGEYLGIRFSDKVIVISKVIEEIVKRRYSKVKSQLIFNGVNLFQLPSSVSVLKTYKLNPKEYVVAVGRFVPEKGFHDLLDAYKTLNINEKLVFIGDADHPSGYSEKLKHEAVEAGVVLTGFQKGESLKELFGNAKLFVLPSYHEGLPIVLLEAISFGLNVLVSDIPANNMVGLDQTEYFKRGDVKDLSSKLEVKLKQKEFKDYRYLINEKYRWDDIAVSTILIYEELVYPKAFSS